MIFGDVWEEIVFLKGLVKFGEIRNIKGGGGGGGVREPTDFHVDTLMAIMTRDFWHSWQGQLFSYKRSVKNDSGRRGTFTPGTIFFSLTGPFILFVFTNCTRAELSH